MGFESYHQEKYAVLFMIMFLVSNSSMSGIYCTISFFSDDSKK